MAELRSFIIGVTIAGALLLFAGLAFGLFGSDSSGSPSVRLLGTPPATRTPAPGATRSPSEFTAVVPTETPAVPAGETPTVPAGETPATGETPSAIQTATPTLEVAPTEAATAAPTATPQVNETGAYIDSANQYTPALVAQVEYLISNVNAPSVNDPSWQAFTLESAQNIQGLAAGLAGISAPACVSAAHGSLVAAANQASASAGGVIAAVQAGDAGAASAAGGGLVAARDAINGAVATVSSTVGSAC